MPNVTTPGLSFPGKAQSSGNPAGVPSGYLGELLISELVGKYSSLVKSGKVYSAYAIVTAPVIFSTAAGTGGPAIWNKPSSTVDAHILGISFGGLSTATSVAGSLGLTGAGGQSIAPTGLTAIDATGNMLVGGPVSQMGGIYRVCTPANPGTQYMPFVAVGTGAITAVEIEASWIDIGGALIIPPGTWGSVAANATLTSGVVGVGLVWAELPA